MGSVMKILLYCFFLVLSFSAHSNQIRLIYTDSQWVIIVNKDKFTDELVCGLISANVDERKAGVLDLDGESNYARISIFPGRENKLLIAGTSKELYGVGLRYRVDRGKAVTLGDSHPTSGSKPLGVVGDDYNQLIGALKNGKQFIFRAFVNSPYYKFKDSDAPLIGFTEAYNLAEKCEYKVE